MYAISDQTRGISTSKKLGLEEQPPNSGHFILDMETAESSLIRKYREVVKKISQETHYKSTPGTPISKRVTYDPQLGEAFQYLLEALNTNSAIHAQAIMLLSSLIDRLAESSQMTIEQQALLRSAYEILKAKSGLQDSAYPTEKALTQDV